QGTAHPSGQVDDDAGAAVRRAQPARRLVSDRGAAQLSGGVGRGEADSEVRIGMPVVHAFEGDFPGAGPTPFVGQSALDGGGETVVTGVAGGVDAVLDLDGVGEQLLGVTDPLTVSLTQRDDVPGAFS